ncbi:hypothetical protein [Rhizobium etli]|uniref:hypothetical protein n=1 Tax=Rhizobium etli TaxID=29449 RepID=UPI0012FD7EE6|nr:hypothetical protein [Rhizobium etli]
MSSTPVTAKLASAGVNAVIRSALKPLLHFFLEEVELQMLAKVHIVFPIHSACAERRFRQETYPLAAMLGSVPLTLEPAATDGLNYNVTITSTSGEVTQHIVFAPNRIHTDLTGTTYLSPTGWMRIGDSYGERLETDVEALFAAVMQAIAEREWGDLEPYFEELNIRASLPFVERPLSVDEEVISLQEALHEDIFFSLSEFFQKRAGAENRRAQPGQIVPEMVYDKSLPSVRIELKPLDRNEASCGFVPFGEAEAPISPVQARAELSAIGGDTLIARARSGRSVDARYKKGSDRPIFISAGQHANETTGIVGALRAARKLSEQPGAHFVISPLENPDDYQLHWRLRRDNPRHQHHAARFTALGDYYVYRSA